MKNYAKVGNRKGKPAYRTPSSFQARRWWHLREIKAVSPRYFGIRRRSPDA